MIRNVRELVQAENDGQTFFATWRKTPTQATSAGIWFDLSMSPGNPVPNYYAASPNVAVALRQSTDGGIPHGGAAPEGMETYLKTICAMTVASSATPLPMLLCDYLLFYPFVDMSITDPQFLDNTVTLPRNVSGRNVQIMAIEVAGQSGVGNPQFFVNYTNSKGESDRQTRNVACNTQTVNGTVISSAAATNFSAGPFLPLQSGDTGVRSIESVTFLSPDVGLIAFVLVDVVENLAIRTIDAPVERTPVTDFAELPIIEDDAYLNFIVLPSGNISGAPIHGYIQTLWG